MKIRSLFFITVLAVLTIVGCSNHNAESISPTPPHPENVNKKDGLGLTPLARANDADEIKALITAGADVNARDSDGMTALIQQATVGRADCVKALIAAGADVNARDNKGDGTALTFAAMMGKTDCVKALIAAGVDVNAKASDGNTALITAALMGNADCINALIAAHANVNARDNNGKTALMVAKSADVAAILRTAGATQ